MLIFSSLNSRIQYLLEGIFAARIAVKIDFFDLDKPERTILIVYRLGRQKLTQKLPLFNFFSRYFDNLSGYDRQRLAKFSTLQDLLTNLLLDPIFRSNF